MKKKIPEYKWRKNITQILCNRKENFEKVKIAKNIPFVKMLCVVEHYEHHIFR